MIFISDCACLQAINLTNSTTGDLVFMGGTKFYPLYAESSRWNTLMIIPASLLTSKAADLEMSSSKNYHPTCRPAITWESKTQATTVSNITLQWDWNGHYQVFLDREQITKQIGKHYINHSDSTNIVHQKYWILIQRNWSMVYTEISQVTHKKWLKGLVGS